jgi:hypothetical protein
MMETTQVGIHSLGFFAHAHQCQHNHAALSYVSIRSLPPYLRSRNFLLASMSAKELALEGRVGS